MRNRNDIIEAIVEQIEWSVQIGKIGLVGMEDIIETAEQILSDDEFEFANETDVFRDALWYI